MGFRMFLSVVYPVHGDTWTYEYPKKYCLSLLTVPVFGCVWSDHTIPHIPYVGCFDVFLSLFCTLGLCVLHETQYRPRDWASSRVALGSCVLLLSCLELHCLDLLSWRTVRDS